MALETNWAALVDGWEDANGESWQNLVLKLAGVPFFHDQATPQTASKQDSGWLLSLCAPVLNEPKCAALGTDCCAVMDNFKRDWLADAAKRKRVVFHMNCQWHGVDSIAGALIGEGGVNAAKYVLRGKFNGVDWNMDARDYKSLIALLRGIVKAFTNRHRLRNEFQIQQRKAFAAAKEEHRAQVLATHADADQPPAPKKPGALSLMAKTRKLSVVRLLSSVQTNVEVLDTVTRSSAFETYVKERSGATKAELIKMAEGVRAGDYVPLTKAMLQLFAILQIHQRLAEKTHANLSDGMYHWQEMRRRINLLSGTILCKDVKQLVLDVIDDRWQKIYTPNMSLAAMLDPRRGFSPDGIDLPNVDVVSDALSCLTKRIEIFPVDKQRRILAGYNALIGTGRRDGTVFDLSGDDEHALKDANNVPLFHWWATYRKPAVAELSVEVCERLFVLSLSQADVERVNGMCSHLQEGRAAMLSETARQWAYIYINGRALKQYHARRRQGYTAGSFALGYGWPPVASDMAVVADEDARAEGPVIPEPTALRDALAALEAAQSAEADAALPPLPAAGAGAAAVKKRKRPTTAEKRAAAAAAAAAAAESEDDDAGEPLEVSDSDTD